MPRPRPSRPAHAPGAATSTPDPTPTPGPTPTSSEVLAQLQVLYAQLPALTCQGLCEHSCAEHIDASAAERTQLLQAGVDLDAPTPDGACPALTRTFGVGRCSVHAIRPTICRLWGTSEAMPCPHGCLPAGGRISDAHAMRLMMSSLEIGGHDHVAAGVRDLLEIALNDNAAAGLFSRFLRGDRQVAVALYDRMLTLRS